MAETHPTLRGSFYKVKEVYYYDRGWRGKRVRISTGQTTLEEAAEWIRNTPFGSRHKQRIPRLSQAFFNRMWGHARHNAKARNIPFDLDRKDIDVLYERSGGHCEVSGLPFDAREVEGIVRRPYMPSIDRVDGMLGYTLTNCRMVCAAVNLAMNEFGENILWEIASSMVIFRSTRRTVVKNSAHPENESVVSG